MLFKEDFEESELKHLKVSNDFQIKFNKENGLIIFGANGIGKTSICNYLLLKYDNYDFLDLDYSAKSAFVKNNSNYIEINTEIDEIEELKRKLLKLEISSTSVLFKKYDVTNSSSSKSISKTFNKVRLQVNKWKDATNLDYFLKTTKDQFKKMEKTFDNRPKEIFKNLSNIRKIEDAKIEFLNYKKSFKKRLLDEVENLYNLDEHDEKECPICGNEVDSLKVIIEEKKKQYLSLKSSIVSDVFKEYSEEEFDSTCKELSTYTDDMILDYILTDGVYERKSGINNEIKEFNEIKKEILLKTIVAKKNYNSLKKIKENAEEYIKTRYPSFESIILDENNLSVKINFSIQIGKLSTGQLNLILFITDLYKFEGSTKEILIMDDPLTSFDLCNQYKIVYEMIEKIIDSTSKKYIVFTHNIELVNISRNQYQSRKISYFIMDSLNDELNISERIEMDEAFFGLNSFHKLSNPYIKFMIKRETNPKAEENKLFHYHGEYNHKGLSNIGLVKNILEYKKVKEMFSSYEELLEFKIITLLSLRIYVEYRLYSTIDDKSIFKKSFELLPLGKKIIEYTNNPALNALVKKKYPRLTRKSLMNKKVMLNQHSHFQGQISPLNYAINISLDDLNREVIEIKNIFG